MANEPARQGPDTQSQGGIYGDAVRSAGVDAQAERRTHMRALTLARQAAERLPTTPSRQGVLTVRAAELARIEAAHQVWVQGGPDLLRAEMEASSHRPPAP